MSVAGRIGEGRAPAFSTQPAIGLTSSGVRPDLGHRVRNSDITPSKAA